jgi:hypothetical protein
VSLSAERFAKLNDLLTIPKDDTIKEIIPDFVSGIFLAGGEASPGSDFVLGSLSLMADAAIDRFGRTGIASLWPAPSSAEILAISNVANQRFLDPVLRSVGPEVSELMVTIS